MHLSANRYSLKRARESIRSQETSFGAKNVENEGSWQVPDNQWVVIYVLETVYGWLCNSGRISLLFGLNCLVI